MFALVKSDSSLTTASLPLPLVEAFLRKIWQISWPRTLGDPQKKELRNFLTEGLENIAARALALLKKNLFRHSLAAGLKISGVRSPQQTSETNPRDTL